MTTDPAGRTFSTAAHGPPRGNDGEGDREKEIAELRSTVEKLTEAVGELVEGESEGSANAASGGQSRENPLHAYRGAFAQLDAGESRRGAANTGESLDDYTGSIGALRQLEAREAGSSDESGRESASSDGEDAGDYTASMGAFKQLDEREASE